MTGSVLHTSTHSRKSGAASAGHGANLAQHAIEPSVELQYCYFFFAVIRSDSLNISLIYSI
jgi:hypothetical protein